MAVRKKKAVWVLLAAAVMLVILGILLSHRNTGSRRGGTEIPLDIEEYSTLSHYFVADNPDSIKDALTGRLVEMEIT